MREDFLAVVQAKRFLGREFLTWLVHRVENGEGRLVDQGGTVEITLGDRLVLAGGPGDREKLVVAGPGDAGAEVGAGLRRGKLVDRARFVITRGERRWELTLDGGMLAYEGLHCPTLGDRDLGAPADARATLENDLFLRLADVEDALGVVDRMFAEFCTLRAGAEWQGRGLPALRAWVDALR